MPTFETTDGTTIHYKDLGTGPVVQLVHAWSLSAEMWEYQVDALLEAGFRVLAPDRRGHGRSAPSRGGYDLTTLADDLHQLLEHLDVRDVGVVAHSMGTCETVRLLARHGAGRIARVALLGTMTPHFAGAAGAGAVEAVIADLRRDRPGWFRAGAPAYFARQGSGAWVSQELVDDGVRTILATPLEVQIPCLRAVALTDLTADVTAVDVPVLLFHGTADASAPLEITGRPTAELLRHAELVELPDAGHGIYVTDRETVHARLLPFLAGSAEPR
ncbi:alpha/beta fold hydrolase [Actinomycetospora sp. CA-101289]|uniref:alpha/beta fold hydrolase n=1 Tax=Actinomycetospora sp. CA-101289 TaxID=3239893 RepID=UPI003D98F4EF